jgi:two-component system response regulator RegA
VKTILVVEDDEVYRAALGRALTRAGFDVRLAAGVGDAEGMAADDPPDLALVDLRLQDGSGVDVVRSLARDAPTCRAVMLSGHGTIRSAVEAMRAGAIDFLTKPVSSEEVVRALEDADKVVLPWVGDTTLDLVEREHILRTLEASGGNVSETARRLGLHRRTLQRKLHKLP